MPNPFCHIELQTNDTDKAKDFYSQLFDWKLLSNYDNSKPFFLSGGIGLETVVEIKNLNGLNLYAIDVNSKFEIKPG
ncbi:MAG: VOC family protein, partial [Bacteroidetes bacterium]|nr:VOC family protein [Bacteroidota bacterium]